MFGLSFVKALVWLGLILFGIAAAFIASDSSYNDASQAKATIAVFCIVVGIVALVTAGGTAFFQWLI